MFEDILNFEYRWPRNGDRLIRVSHAATDARVATDTSMRLFLQCEGFKRSADIAVEHARQTPRERDSLLYPILSNYRHFIELSLKGLIADYGPSVGVDPIWTTHNLRQLWQTFRRVSDEFGVIDGEQTNDVVEQLIDELDALDPGSDACRYPVDTKGKPIVLSMTQVDLENLKDVIEGVAGFFDGCDGYMGDLRSACPYESLSY